MGRNSRRLSDAPPPVSGGRQSIRRSGTVGLALRLSTTDLMMAEVAEGVSRRFGGDLTLGAAVPSGILERIDEAALGTR
jgi:hypothetical protein